MSKSVKIKAKTFRQEVIEPGVYFALVGNVDDRWDPVKVRFSILDDQDETITNIEVKLSLEHPTKKLLHFLGSIGMPVNLEEDFDVVPTKWRDKCCKVDVDQHEYTTEKGEVITSNRITKFFPR